MDKFITFEDLLLETGIDSQKDLLRIIKANKLPQVSPNKPVQFTKASKIVKYLTNRPLSWRKYKEDIRDSQTEYKPLQRYKFDINQILNEWLSQVYDVDDIGSKKILGFVTKGGFLRGSIARSPYVVKINNGINIIIGDRGTGKSTTLSLLSLLTGEVVSDSSSFVNSIINLLKNKKENEQEKIRRISNTLKHYGVSEYCCFFSVNDQILCFYANVNFGWDLLIRKSNEWYRSTLSISSIDLKIQIFRQGEVFRIADDEESLAFNNLLDGVYNSLLISRKKIAKNIPHLKIAFENFEPIRIDFDVNKIYRILTRLSSELDEIRAERSIKNTIELIESYMYSYDTLDVDLPDKPIIELFKNDYDGIICLYIGRIYRYLKSMLYSLKKYLIHDEDYLNIIQMIFLMKYMVS